QVKDHGTFSLLDVGPRTGAGLALLRLMHHPASFSRLKLDPVLGLDMDPAFEFTAFREFPDIAAKTGDLFSVPDKSWDIVTCSHTIEHIEDAEGFVEQILRIARMYVVLACPFAEQALSSGHIQSIDYAFLRGIGFPHVKIYESHHWHNGVCCLAFKSLK